MDDYFKRFSAATMVTKGVTDEETIQAFITRTSHQHLKYIIKNTPTKLSHLCEMVHKFTKRDEVGKVHANSTTLASYQSNHPQILPPRRFQGH
ncbi:hypothetical protein J1N35_031684 [Gossypium stocksii]|uniref:Uncharacterized protein n=1 Tax=Gossypium stocksii TaxID=47602 RepID=A0A9D3ZVB7_9ROSI|nr:hypothetical protein J1N35_031684 [Gossypium stocksii]